MTDIKALSVPKWGMAMEEGTLVNWLIEEGDIVNAGDEIAEIESSKIINVLVTHEAGTIRRKIAQVDDTLPVGGLLAVIAGDNIPDSDIDRFISGYSAVNPEEIIEEPEVIAKPQENKAANIEQELATQPTKQTIPDSLKHGAADEMIAATPQARRFARQHGINLNNITGTGRHGRISLQDIEQAIADAGGGAGPEEYPLSPMRRTIARRLQTAKMEVPHYRVVADARISPLLDIRKTFNESRPDCNISLNDLLIKACATSLLQVPDCNVQFDGNTIKRFRTADIAVAVALDDGLITPIVFNADDKDIFQISAEVRGLIKKAKKGTLKQIEYHGGTFTVSNLGMFGVKQFDAIINPPQCGVLAVGATGQRMIVEQGEPVIADMLTLSCSFDHRIIDGALGAKFLKTLVNTIEQPQSLTAGTTIE